MSVPESVNLTENEIFSVIRQRRTIGSFRPEPPARELVLAALEAARWAPNHRKTEPWHVSWLGPETIAAVVELNCRIVAEEKGAQAADSKRQRWLAVPGWLLVNCDLSDDPLRCEEDYAACCCFIQNLSLALWSLGIGTKWSTGEVICHADFPMITGFDPTRQRPAGLLWYGYPDAVPQQTRREVSAFLKELP